MAYQTLVIALCLLWFSSPNAIISRPDTWLNIVILGTVCTALPHALIAFTLTRLRAKTFSLIACMQPFYGVIFAILILNESPSWQTFLGGALVICAACYETVNTHREQQGN